MRAHTVGGISAHTVGGISARKHGPDVATCLGLSLLSLLQVLPRVCLHFGASLLQVCCKSTKSLPPVCAHGDQNQLGLWKRRKGNSSPLAGRRDAQHSLASASFGRAPPPDLGAHSKRVWPGRSAAGELLLLALLLSSGLFRARPLRVRCGPAGAQKRRSRGIEEARKRAARRSLAGATRPQKGRKQSKRKRSPSPKSERPMCARGEHIFLAAFAITEVCACDAIYLMFVTLCAPIMCPRRPPARPG